MRLRSRSGVTLIEVMVAFGIFSVILSALLMTLMAGNRSWKVNNAVISTQANVRRAIIFLSRDLREANALVVTGDATSRNVTFSQPRIGTVSYTWTNTGSNANRILRVRPSNTFVVAQNISSFNVVDGTNNITISVTSAVSDVQGTINTFSLDAKVTKR